MHGQTIHATGSMAVTEHDIVIAVRCRWAGIELLGTRGD